MSQPGRTPLLDDFKQGEMCAILTMGGSRRTAAKYVGCSPDTIRRTAENDEDFRQRLQQAKSNLELHHLGKIKDAAEKNWRASAWVLERVHPERFAKRDPDAITPEQLAAVVSCTVDILIEEVPQVEHQRVLKRVTRWSPSCCRAETETTETATTAMVTTENSKTARQIRLGRACEPHLSRPHDARSLGHVGSASADAAIQARFHAIQVRFSASAEADPTAAHIHAPHTMIDSSDSNADANGNGADHAPPNPATATGCSSPAWRRGKCCASCGSFAII